MPAGLSCYSLFCLLFTFGILIVNMIHQLIKTKTPIRNPPLKIGGKPHRSGRKIKNHIETHTDSNIWSMNLTNVHPKNLLNYWSWSLQLLHMKTGDWLFEIPGDDSWRLCGQNWSSYWVKVEISNQKSWKKVNYTMILYRKILRWDLIWQRQTFLSSWIDHQISQAFVWISP